MHPLYFRGQDHLQVLLEVVSGKTTSGRSRTPAPHALAAIELNGRSRHARYYIISRLESLEAMHAPASCQRV
jgi:hypothetical protein